MCVHDFSSSTSSRDRAKKIYQIYHIILGKVIIKYTWIFYANIVYIHWNSKQYQVTYSFHKIKFTQFNTLKKISLYLHKDERQIKKPRALIRCFIKWYTIAQSLTILLFFLLFLFATPMIHIRWKLYLRMLYILENWPYFQIMNWCD